MGGCEQSVKKSKTIVTFMRNVIIGLSIKNIVNAQISIFFPS